MLPSSGLALRVILNPPVKYHCLPVSTPSFPPSSSSLPSFRCFLPIVFLSLLINIHVLRDPQAKLLNLWMLLCDPLFNYFLNQLLFLSNSYISPLSPRVPFKPLVNLIVPSSLSPLASLVCSVFYLSSIFHSYFSQFALLSCYFFCFLFNFSCACWISLRIPFYPPLVISIPLWYSLYFCLVSPYFFSFSLFTKKQQKNPPFLQSNSVLL